MLRTVVASAVVASAAAFSAPSAFMGKGLATQVMTACITCRLLRCPYVRFAVLCLLFLLSFLLARGGRGANSRRALTIAGCCVTTPQNLLDAASRG